MQPVTLTPADVTQLFALFDSVKASQADLTAKTAVADSAHVTLASAQSDALAKDADKATAATVNAGNLTTLEAFLIAKVGPVPAPPAAGS